MWWMSGMHSSSFCWVWASLSNTLPKIGYNFGQRASQNRIRLWATCCTKSDKTLGKIWRDLGKCVLQNLIRPWAMVLPGYGFGLVWRYLSKRARPRDHLCRVLHSRKKFDALITTPRLVPLTSKSIPSAPARVSTKVTQASSGALFPGKCHSHPPLTLA